MSPRASSKRRQRRVGAAPAIALVAIGLSCLAVPAAAASSSTTSSTPSPTTTAPSIGRAPVNLTSATAPTVLTGGTQINAPGGQWWLAIQNDGNLVEYAAQPSVHPTWQSGTGGNPGASLSIQKDGNVVVYSSANQALWQSATHGYQVTLSVDDAGHFTVAAPDGRVLFDTGAGTSVIEDTLPLGQTLLPGQALYASNGAGTAAFQKDGNFVLYRSGAAVWQSHTYAEGAAKLVVQSDGNLVIYSTAGRPLWWSGTNNTVADHLVMQSDGNLVLYGPTGPEWSNGNLLTQLPTTVGVYAYSSPTKAIADGWPIIGVTGAIGTCSSPFTGALYSPHHGNDEQTGFAIQKSGKKATWLSFWTVSGPSKVASDQSCQPTPSQAPLAFYADGFNAGKWVASQIDSYAADGLSIKPNYVIFDPEGYPDNHSGLDGNIDNPAGPGQTAIDRWNYFLAGWATGIKGVDPSLVAGFYADQAEYRAYGLKNSTLPAFIAVAFGASSSTTGYPLVNPLRLPGVNGANIKGFIAFFAGPPFAAQCKYARTEAQYLNGWGAPYNTLQFDPGQSCRP